MYLTKTLRVVQLTSILLLVACLQVAARGTAQRVTLSVKDEPVEQVFQEIQTQTGYTFVYSKEDVQPIQHITLDVQDASITAVLDHCLKNAGLGFSIEEKYIVIKRTPTPVTPLNPPGDVHGTVVDENGQPLEGVSVKIKGTNRGTTTSATGEFTLHNVSDNDILVFSGTNIIGFETKPNGQRELSLTAKAQVGNLQEVVVNKGYYSVKQRENTGNVSVVRGDDIANQPMSDPILALEGRVSGLSITPNSGVPGSASTVRLRGQNSISNGNNPLYLVDGVPFTSTSLTSTYFVAGAVSAISPFNSLSPSDIESIEVLKDADATAIYGSRGANGVILITTKKGKSGKTKIDINVNSGYGRVAKTVDLLNTKEYLTMRHEAFFNDGVTALPPNAYDINGKWDTTRYTDWQKVFLGGTSDFTNIQASVSGGDMNTKFLLGGGFNSQTTVFPGNFSDQKASLHFNIVHTSDNKKFNLMFSGNYVVDDSKLPTVDLTSNITLAPDAPDLYNANGELNWEGDTWTNPFGILYQTSKAVQNNLIGNLNLSYEISPGLEIKSNFGYNRFQMDQSKIVPLISYSPSYSAYSFARRNDFGTNTLKTWIIEPQVRYKRDVGLGKFDVLISGTFQENNQNAISQYASDFSSDALIENVAAAVTKQIQSLTNTDYKYASVFGRIGYGWNEKYLINATGRRDGSSRFGPRNQFGSFGAIGAAWIFSKESFVIDNLRVLSFGKLRASYGYTGNDQSADYLYLGTYSSYRYSYQGVNGLYPTQIANPDFGWEKVKKIEVALELGLFRDRIMLNTAYYENRTENQLVGYPLPDITGFPNIPGYNLPAVIQNMGVEIELNTVNIRSERLSWLTSINLSIPKNKLISYPDLESSTYANSYEIGRSLFVKKLFRYNGVDPQTGLYRFSTRNANGIPSYPDDIAPTVGVAPHFFGGVSNTVKYNGFQLDFFFQFVKQQGYTWINNFSQPGIFGGTNANMPTTVLRRWQKPGDITDIQRFSSSDPNASSAFSNVRFSDRLIDDASFIRLKNVSLSYQLPKKWQSRMHLQNARIYLLGSNLVTFTKYLGLDPEIWSLSLPPIRTITVGIQLAF